MGIFFFFFFFTEERGGLSVSNCLFSKNRTNKQTKTKTKTKNTLTRKSNQWEQITLTCSAFGASIFFLLDYRSERDIWPSSYCLSRPEWLCLLMFSVSEWPPWPHFAPCKTSAGWTMTWLWDNDADYHAVIHQAQMTLFITFSRQLCFFKYRSDSPFVYSSIEGSRP